MIEVLFFGRLKEQLGCAGLSCRVETDLPIDALKTMLIEQHPGWRKYLFDSQLLVAVDQLMAEPKTMIKPDSQVAFFPPVTGG